MTEFGDKEIKELFERMRVDDRDAAPSFRQTLQGVSQKASDAPPSFSLAKPVAATALLAVISAVLLVPLRQPSQPSAIQTAADISRWTSPTRSLLRSPAEELLSGRVRLLGPQDWMPQSALDSAKNPLPKEERK